MQLIARMEKGALIRGVSTGTVMENAHRGLSMSYLSLRWQFTDYF